MISFKQFTEETETERESRLRRQETIKQAHDRLKVAKERERDRSMQTKERLKSQGERIKRASEQEKVKRRD